MSRAGFSLLTTAYRSGVSRSGDYAEPKKLNDLAVIWRDTNKTYEDRISQIRSVEFGLRQNETVFDDFSLDYDFGATDQDWFFVEATRDNYDRQANETLS